MGYLGIGCCEHGRVLEYYRSCMKDPDCKGGEKERASSCVWSLVESLIICYDETWVFVRM